MKRISFIKNEKGLIGLYLAIVIMVFALGMIASVSFGIFTQQQIIRNMVQSTQAHYAAESGAEDALLRVYRDPNWSPGSYTIALWTGPSATVAVDDSTPGVRIVTVEGDSTNRLRNTEVVFEISSSIPGFNYGAQVGEGGVQMGNNGIIDGNVFSNGSIVGANGATASGTVIVSGIGNKISNVDIAIDAYTDICENGADIVGVLHTNSPGNCNYGSVTNSGLPVVPIALPIPDSDVQIWQQEAEAGGILNSDQNITGLGNTLGPVKIVGNLEVNNNAELIVTGTIWVTGHITIQNGATVRLASGYGSTSGTIIGGDRLNGQNSNIQLLNGSVSKGSGSAGSYLMYIADSDANPAIHVHEGFTAVDIVYANHGWITLENNADVRQITAYGLNIQNNAVVTYEFGLAAAEFTSGPGGGWTVTSWKEIE